MDGLKPLLVPLRCSWPSPDSVRALRYHVLSLWSADQSRTSPDGLIAVAQLARAPGAAGNVSLTFQVDRDTDTAFALAPVLAIGKRHAPPTGPGRRLFGGQTDPVGLSLLL